MSFFKFQFVLLAATLTFYSCKKKSETIHFTALAYNVAGLPDGISSSMPSLHQPFIGKLINEVDVVHVQEDFNYHDSLLKYNTHPFVTPHIGGMTYGDGLSTFSNFPVSGLERVEWTDCEGFDCYTPKGFSYSRIEVTDGAFVDFYNVHCNASTNAEALIARQKNIRQLCNFVKERSAGNAVVLMGDFNCRYTRSGDSIRNVLDMGFVDSWVSLIRGGSIPTANDISLTDCGVNGDQRTAVNCEKVDKIFFRSGDKIKLSATAYKLDDRRYYYNNNDTIPLSDHWPVFTSFMATIEQ